MQYAVGVGAKKSTPHAVHAVGVGAKKSNQCMQYTVHSGIVVYGGVDIVFGVKRSNQWMGTLCKCKTVNDESAKRLYPTQ